jgi:hypothetical protein
MLDNLEAKVGPAGETASWEKTALRRQFLDLLERRRSVTPLRLSEPGPNSEELPRMLTIATRVPDHGALEPWRIIVVEGRAREELGERLAAAFLKSNPEEVTATVDLAVRKIKAVFTAAPLILIVVSCADSSARPRMGASSVLRRRLYEPHDGRLCAWLRLDVAQRMGGLPSGSLEASRSSVSRESRGRYPDRHDSGASAGSGSSFY